LTWNYRSNEDDSGSLYAVAEAGKRYPPKRILELATGVPRNKFYGGKPSTSVWAAHDPLMGTWTLNLPKSTYSPGPPPKSSLNTYGPYGEDGFTYDAVQVDA
jgi:hypothetical protein